MIKSFFSKVVSLTAVFAIATVGVFGAKLADSNPVLGSKVTNLDKWQFAKSAPEMWTNVTIPHSCNAIDGHSSSYYRGKTYYKKILNFTSEQAAKPQFLLFEGAAQAATVSVNGKVLTIHKGGYTPFVVSLKDAVKPGENEILVIQNQIFLF